MLLLHTLFPPLHHPPNSTQLSYDSIGTLCVKIQKDGWAVREGGGGVVGYGGYGDYGGYDG